MRSAGPDLHKANLRRIMDSKGDTWRLHLIAGLRLENGVCVPLVMGVFWTGYTTAMHVASTPFIYLRGTILT